MTRSTLSFVLLLAALCAPASAQVPGRGAAAGSLCDPRSNPHCTEVAALAARPAVQRALAIIDETDDLALRQLITLTEIPAPPFMEEARAAAYADMLREAGTCSHCAAAPAAAGPWPSPGTSTPSSRKAPT